MHKSWLLRYDYNNKNKSTDTPLNVYYKRRQFRKKLVHTEFKSCLDNTFKIYFSLHHHNSIQLWTSSDFQHSYSLHRLYPGQLQTTGSLHAAPAGNLLATVRARVDDIFAAVHAERNQAAAKIAPIGTEKQFNNGLDHESFFIVMLKKSLYTTSCSLSN